MTNIRFREATTADVPSLLSLEQNIIESERPYDRFLKNKDVTYYDIPELITDPDSHLLVVESEKRIIGSGYAQIRPSRSIHRYDSYCYLGFIYLEPEHRGKAIGRTIIEKLKDWGLHKGISHFQLNVYAENKAAIRAYEKAGYNKVSVLMELVV